MVRAEVLAGNMPLYVRGRDVHEQKTALQFDSDTGKWVRLGPGEDFRIKDSFPLHAGRY